MQNKIIFNAANEYLLSFEGVTQEMIDKQLNEWRERKAQNIPNLCYQMISSAKNRQGMSNSIGDIDKISSIVFDFNPNEILKNYTEWGELFDKIKEGYTPPGRMERNNPRNYWVQFTKSIISIANFLQRFKTVEDFDKFVRVFYYNEETRAALPLLLEKEIFGYRFALACDFLKESGYPKFVKPDTHIKDIFTGLGLTKDEDDFQIFKDVISFSESIDKLPYEVDKLFWLVGSGRFYLFKDENGNEFRIKTSKKEFIKIVKEKLNH
ncbi:MAG: hypothetical protein B6U86_01320 [Candidatus Altiarchaeales archaeon ex4484_43]|nr:MAG: hypothetical protein B6U86_01320 [Candidatus Altiarchaeales archaeon ex4484_43]